MKADEIESVLYENLEHNVFGMFYEVGGNAASQSQFYVTDSINHFLTALYISMQNLTMILFYQQQHILKTILSILWKL